MESDTEIISKLKFISRIQKSQKIDTVKLRVYGNTSLTSLVRTIRGDDARGSTLSFLSQTAQQALDLVDRYLAHNRSGELKQATLIIEDLTNLKTAINNLQFTYSSDLMFKCRLESLGQLVESKLCNLRKQHPDLFSSSLPTTASSKRTKSPK